MACYREKLKKSILADEKSAPHDYHKLYKVTSDKSDKRKIKGIIKDEKRHYKEVRSFK